MMWKVLKDNPHYSVSNTGVVKRNAYKRVDKIGRITQVKEMELKQHLDKDGYYRVSIIYNNKTKFIPVHRLVAQHFLDKSEYNCVNHKNEIKTDNRVENLEWCNVSYNNNYGSRNLRVSKTQGKKVIGISKEKTIVFNSSNEAERYFKNKNGSNIAQCCNGKFKKMYGYEWRWV